MNKLFLLALFGCLTNHLFSQHEHHAMTDSMQNKSAPKKMTTMDAVDHSIHSMSMPTHSYSRNLPMNRNGSGTGLES